jgi:hypothetical protein
MRFTLPVIGGATQFGTRTARGFRRNLSLQEVIDSPSPFPMLLIPCVVNKVPNHALCVVDDLVFDSIKKRALRLCHESFQNIFNDETIYIYRACRFDQNLTPKQNKSFYTRDIIWHPAPPSST